MTRIFKSQPKEVSIFGPRYRIRCLQIDEGKITQKISYNFEKVTKKKVSFTFFGVIYSSQIEVPTGREIEINLNTRVTDFQFFKRQDRRGKLPGE